MIVFIQIPHASVFLCRCGNVIPWTFYNLILIPLTSCIFYFQIPINKKNKKERYQEELEERIVSLIASLFGKKASEVAFEFFIVFLIWLVTGISADMHNILSF